MIITREKGMRMWGGGSGSTSASGVNGGGGFSLEVTEGEGTGNAYTGFTYESGVLSLIKGEKFVTVDFFNRLFTAYDSDGNAILPNDVTSTINNLKLLVGTWTEEYLSALGKNSEGGGGGGGIELSDVWQSLKTNTDDYANQKINIAHIPDLSGTYATKTWVNQQGFLTTHQTLYTLSIYGGTTKVLDFKPNANASIYIKAGGDISLTNDTTNKYITLSYTHPTNGANTTISAASGKVLSAITVNSLGHVTSVSSKTLAAADIPDISATYATASRATTLEGYFTNGVAKTAAKLNTGTTTYTAWGQTYWSSGVPQSISGNMTSVGSITPSANGNALGTTSARFNIYGTSGNFSGNVSIGGTLGVTGATTLSSTLSVAGGITLTTTKKIYFGDTSHYLELTSTGFHFSHGIYSDSFVSALGSNSSGGGSGTFDEEAMWTALGTTSSAKVIASSHIPNLSWAKITSGKPTTLSGYGITNAYTKTQVDNALSGYLPLSGGTLTGTLAMKFDTDTSRAWGYQWKNTSGTSIASIIYHNTAQNIILNPVGSSETWSDAVGKYSLIVGNNSLTYNTYPILHSNNYSSYALPLTGGTLTGNLISTKSGTSETYFRATNSNGSIELLTSTNRGVYDRTTATWLIGTDGTNTRLSQGNVGIGTTSPAYKLDVVGSIRASDVVYVGTGGATGNSYVASDEADNIYLRNSSGAVLVCDGKVVRRGTTLSDVTLGSSSYPWLAAYATTFYGALSGNATTSTTASKLSTVSKTAWGQTYWTSGGVPTSISGNLSDVGNITADYYTLNNTAANPYLKLVHTYNSTNYNYYIQAYNGLLYLGAGSANSVAINSSGNVGIGTASPAYALDVVGTTRSSEGFRTATANGSYGFLDTRGCTYCYLDNYSSGFATGMYIVNSSGTNLGSAVGVFGTGNAISRYYYGGTWNNPLMTILPSGNVGIGNTSPSQKLHVTGNILASGEVTASSDGRKKNIISNTKFNVKDIASARSILYEWNDDRDKDNEKKIHGGSIAQDWIGKADSFLSQDGEGWYSINYGALALCSAITIARMTINHEDRITLLEKENAKLKARVAELEERRIA